MVATADNMVQNRVGRFVKANYADAEITNDYEMRRAFPRYAMSDTVDVMLDSAQTPAEVIMATGRDISMGGIGIYSHRPIPEGTEMIINIENGKDRLLTKAVAIHSTMSVGLFKVGARFII